MKKALVKWMFLLPAGFFWAVGIGSVYAEAPQALTEILKRTESNYQQMQAFTASFRQWTTSSAASGMVTEASGKVSYQKPRQMHWEYEKPEHQVFVANHQIAWLYVPAEKQISLFDAKNFFASPLAQTFFDGIIELKKHFEVSLDPKQSSSTAAFLKLVPKEEDPNIKWLFLQIDLQTYRIISIEGYDHLGNTNRIALDSQQATARLDQNLFQLNVPPTTMVLDIDGRELSLTEIEKLKAKLHVKQE
ncbi:MAG: outer membrane lipoprotein carrier protein LolA [Syntrophobacteraceae bacterium]